jgi:hypothetical protein
VPASAQWLLILGEVDPGPVSRCAQELQARILAVFCCQSDGTITHLMQSTCCLPGCQQAAWDSWAQPQLVHRVACPGQHTHSPAGNARRCDNIKRGSSAVSIVCIVCTVSQVTFSTNDTVMRCLHFPVGIYQSTACGVVSPSASASRTGSCASKLSVHCIKRYAFAVLRHPACSPRPAPTSESPTQTRFGNDSAAAN